MKQATNMPFNKKKIRTAYTIYNGEMIKTQDINNEFIKSAMGKDNFESQTMLAKIVLFFNYLEDLFTIQAKKDFIKENIEKKDELSSNIIFFLNLFYNPYLKMPFVKSLLKEINLNLEPFGEVDIKSLISFINEIMDKNINYSDAKERVIYLLNFNDKKYFEFLKNLFITNKQLIQKNLELSKKDILEIIPNLFKEFYQSSFNNNFKKGVMKKTDKIVLMTAKKNWKRAYYTNNEISFLNGKSLKNNIELKEELMILTCNDKNEYLDLLLEPIEKGKYKAHILNHNSNTKECINHYQNLLDLRVKFKIRQEQIFDKFKLISIIKNKLVFLENESTENILESINEFRLETPDNSYFFSIISKNNKPNLKDLFYKLSSLESLLEQN